MSTVSSDNSISLARLLSKVGQVSKRRLVNVEYYRDKRLQISLINDGRSKLIKYTYDYSTDTFLKETVSIFKNKYKQSTVPCELSKKLFKLIMNSERNYEIHTATIYKGYAINIETGELLTPITYKTYVM